MKPCRLNKLSYELCFIVSMKSRKRSAAGGYVGLAERRTKSTNRTYEERLTNNQTVGPEGQTKVAKVRTKILSDDFVVPPEGVGIIVSIV